MLLLQKQKNSKKQGDVGLAIAIAWFAQNGYHVAIPLTDSQDYDLVVEVNGKFRSVQVRTTYFKNPQGNYVVNLRVLGGNRSGTGKVKFFDPQKVDYLFVVTDSGEKYLFPSKLLEVRSALTLYAKYALYKVE
jgi:hypothetical protein